MTREDYKADQVNAARVSGTDKGKRAVRSFLRAVAERLSDGAVGSVEWDRGPWDKMGVVNNLFWKWVMEVPPWGTPKYNAVVCTTIFSWDAMMHRMRYRDTLVNLFSETEQDWLYRWAMFRLIRMEMKRIERESRKGYLRRVAKRWLRSKTK